MLFCSNAFSQLVVGTIEINKDFFNLFFSNDIEQQDLSNIDFEKNNLNSGNWLSKKNYLDFEELRIKDNTKLNNSLFVDKEVEDAVDEEELEVHNWMTNIALEENNIEIQEEEIEIVTWMTELECEDYEISGNNILDKEHKLEEWMLNENFWVLSE